MSSTGPNSNAIPPDLKNYDRNRSLQLNNDFHTKSGHRGNFPAPADELFHPSLSSGAGEKSLGTAARNLPDRDSFFSPISEIGDLPDHNGLVPTNWVADPPPLHSSNTVDHTMDYTDQCPIDNTQAELKNLLLNPARTEPALRFSSDKHHSEVDSSAFVSTLNTDTINRLSNLTRKLENAKLLSPVPLTTENPIPLKAVQNQKKRNKRCSNWMKLDLKQKVRLVNKLGASKIRMALKKSIWIKRVKNLARKKHLNLANIQKPIKTINPDVVKLSEAEENHLKEASVGTIEKNKHENNIDADKKKERREKL
ncbi:hypothetical protein LXL04_027726 [Taraxacum kok-saghyz]